jgi:hypothetical protein
MASELASMKVWRKQEEVAKLVVCMEAPICHL